MRFRIGRCCCAPIPTSTGLWDWYKDHFAGDVSPATIETPYVPRVGSIYFVTEDDLISEAIPDYDSHPIWAAEITGTDSSNFQSKTVNCSISELGDTSNEIVYIHVSDSVTARTATIKINAVTTGVEWIQMDTEWSDPDNPMPAVSIATVNPFNRPGVGAPPIDKPGDFALHSPESAGNAASVNGLVSWRFYNGDSLGQRPANSVRKWSITPAGVDSYEQYHFHEDWLNANGGQQDEFPEYTYFLPFRSVLYLGVFDVDTLIKHGFNTYHFPVGHSPQGDYAIGIRYAHIDNLPAELTPNEEFPYGENHGDVYLPEATVKIGPLQIDNDGFPFVNGETIWTFSEGVSYVIGDFNSFPDAGMWVVFTRVDGFDAGRIMEQTKSIAIITFYYTESFAEDDEGLFYSDEQTEKSDLVINGIVIETFTVFKAVGLYNAFLNNVEPLFLVDNRDFYPQWIHPRTLQKTEAIQGGGHRHVIFQRMPETEAISNTEWNGDRRVGNWRLKCYLGISLEWSLESNWGRNGQAAGEVTFNTSNNATFPINARYGGLADGTAANGTLTINIVNRTEEDAVYDEDTNTLTVYLDIDGGNDTIEDLRDVIEDGGDFQTSPSANETDVVSDSTEGTGTLSGGDDAASVSVTNPQIHDSSDRYMYVYNFPLRVKERFGNRWKCLFRAAGGYPQDWMISHDGTILNPAGAGHDRHTRRDEFPGLRTLSYGCIKNSELIPLCPGYEKI